MPTPSIKFKKMLFSYDKETRRQILEPLVEWLRKQIPNDPNASACYNSIQTIKDLTAEPRKAIPKKIRGEAWKIQFGGSTNGSCFCCKKELDVFDDWHAGHIISHSNGGTDTALNLRPVCGSCNLSMGTENMDTFKSRCYPN